MKKSFFRVLMLLLCLSMLLVSTGCIQKNEKSAKEFYVDLVDSMSKVLKENKKNTKINFVKAKLDLDVDFYHKEPTTDWYSAFDYYSSNDVAVTKEAKETSAKETISVKMDTEKKLVLVNCENINLLFDISADKLYFKDSNSKDVYSFDMPEELSSSMKQLSFETDMPKDESFEKIMDKIFKYAKESLKDEYFSLNKEDGLNVYQLEINDKFLAQYVEDILLKLKDDKEFKELIVNKLKENEEFTKVDNFDSLWNESFHSMVKSLENLNETNENGFEFFLKTFVKGSKLSEIRKIIFTGETKDDSNKFKVNLNAGTEDNKSLFVSKKFNLDGKLSFGDSEEVSFGCNSKNIFLNTGVKYKNQFVMYPKELERPSMSDFVVENMDFFGFDEVAYQKAMDEYNTKVQDYMRKQKEIIHEQKMLISVKGMNDKDFDKDSGIVLKYTLQQLEDSVLKEEQKSEVIIKSTNGKAFKDSNGISLKVVSDDKEVMEEKLILSTTDKKSFKDTSGIVFEFDENNKFKVETIDKKSFSKTSGINFIIDENKFFKLESTDKKSLKDAKSIKMSWKADDMLEGFIEFKKNLIEFEFNTKEESSYLGETVSKFKGKLTLDDKIKFDEINTSKAIDKKSKDLYKILKDARKDQKAEKSLIDYILASSSDTTERAQLAVFINNFSQFYDRVTMDALNIKQTVGVKGERINDAQLNYMVANGLDTSIGNPNVENMELPEGYVLPKTLNDYYNVSDKEVVAYVINDNNITSYDEKPATSDGSASYEFYGDDNGKEYHYITSNGHVFTLPGFPLENSDGTITYYLSNERKAYYTVKGSSSLNMGEVNVKGDPVNMLNPITHEDLVASGTNKISK